MTYGTNEFPRAGLRKRKGKFEKVTHNVEEKDKRIRTIGK